MKFKLMILAGLIVPSLVWTSAQAQPFRKIRIGYPSISSRQAQLWIAKDEGIFRKHGLDVELIFLRGGQVAIQALPGGDPEQFVDLSFLQELEKEGFFEEMARRYR